MRHSNHGSRRINASASEALVFAEWREWLDHQYVPGYWLGSRIPPLLRRGDRPNPNGYALLVVAAFNLLVLAVIAVLSGSSPPPLGLAVVALEVLAGLRLLRRI